MCLLPLNQLNYLAEFLAPLPVQRVPISRLLDIGVTVHTAEHALASLDLSIPSVQAVILHIGALIDNQLHYTN